MGVVSAPGLNDASGLNVTLRDAKGSAAAPASQVTGADGGFVFYDVPPGTYSIEVASATLPQRYRSTVTESIEVLPGKRSDANIFLEPRRSVLGRTYVDVDRDG
ncbi:MAG: carboxypeptidase regulatory-like domain-containing protein, partial [Acidobacteria bacterium]|nr:carboxypeptidase regulatory-like domain-containing protein [Acidobacteriota bacterium]